MFCLTHCCCLCNFSEKRNYNFRNSRWDSSWTWSNHSNLVRRRGEGSYGGWGHFSWGWLTATCTGSTVSWTLGKGGVRAILNPGCIPWIPPPPPPPSSYHDLCMARKSLLTTLAVHAHRWPYLLGQNSLHSPGTKGGEREETWCASIHESRMTVGEVSGDRKNPAAYTVYSCLKTLACSAPCGFCCTTKCRELTVTCRTKNERQRWKRKIDVEVKEGVRWPMKGLWRT